MSNLTRAVSLGCLVIAAFSYPLFPATAQQPQTAAGKGTATAKELRPVAVAAPPQEPTTLPAAWIGVGIVLLLALVAAVLWAAGKPQDPYIRCLGPSFFFWLGMLYLSLLLLVAGLYLTNCFGFMEVLEPIGKVVPLCVIWFGALGAVAISLQGVFDHNEGWDPSYNYWHIGRPLFGVVVGIVAYFLLQLIVAASGAQAPGHAVEHNTIFYCVMAFLVGYREAIFRDLLKQAVDLFLRPAPPPPPAPVVTIKVGGGSPLVIACGNVPANTRKPVVVELQNTGNAPLMQPHVTVTTTAPAPGTSFALDNDHLSGLPELQPGRSATVDVVFTPNAAGAFAGTLTVTGTNLATPKTIRITGTGT
jgi:hypothetical protein